MTEFERPQRAPLPRPSSTSQLQLGHAGARGGELGGGEPTTGARLGAWGSGWPSQRQAGARRGVLCGLTQITGAVAAAAGPYVRVQR